MKTIRTLATLGMLLALAAGANAQWDRPAPGDYWYRLDIDGRHAGWARDAIVDETVSGRSVRVIRSDLLLHCIWEVDADVELHIGPETYSGPSHYRIDLKQETGSTARYDENGLLFSEYRSVERDRKAIRVVIRPTVHGYEVTANVGDDSRRWTVKPEDFDATSNALYEIPELATEPGVKTTLRVLDLTTGQVVTRRFQLVAVERRTIGGERRTVRRVEVEDEKETVTTWLDAESGLAVRIDLAGDPVVRVESATERTARDFTPPTMKFETPPPSIRPGDPTAQERSSPENRGQPHPRAIRSAGGGAASATNSRDGIR